MNIAITGATGFLGRYLVNHLLTTGHDLFILTRSLKKIDINKYSHKNIHLLETDYTYESLKKVFPAVDVLVHLASKRYNPKQNDFLDYKINLDISKNLFKICEDKKLKNVIFSSSRSIYSNINTLPSLEDEIVKPANPYSLSKLKVEEISSFYNINCKSLRIAQLIGWGEREQEIIFMLRMLLLQSWRQ